jgi:hypothetical protein
MLKSLPARRESSVGSSGQTIRLQFTPEQEQTVRRELDLILVSPQFAGSKRCHDFLVFIVNRTLEGNADNLTERFIGADLFGRSIDYDTKADSIVRVCANDVRRRLADYHSHQSSSRPVMITLSAGTYIPEFQWYFPENSAQDPAGGVAHSLRKKLPATDAQVLETASVVSSKQNPVTEFQAELGPRPVVQHLGWSRRKIATSATVVGLVILALSISCFTLWYELRETRQLMYPWKNSPAVAAFWETFLADHRDADLVFADSSYSLLQTLTNKPISLDDYINRNYASVLQGQSPEMAAALSRISKWGLGSSSEFEVLQSFLALDPGRQKIRLYSSRKYMPDLIMRDNVILIGSRFGNPWAQLFESRMNFVFQPDNQNQIVNRTPASGEAPVYEYSPNGSVGYCVVAYLPNPDRNGKALLIQGTSGEPTQAAEEFLLSENEMSNFLKKLRASKFPYFELLLKTSWIKGTPISSSIVAYRIYTDPQ